MNDFGPGPLPLHLPSSRVRNLARALRAGRAGSSSTPSWVTRLNFYKVQHPLTWTLAPYETTKRPTLMQRASWDTLLYWDQLLDTAPRWPELGATRKPLVRVWEYGT